MEQKKSIAEVASRLEGPFKHLVIGQVDDYCAYLTRIEGSYIFHHHTRDEMYMVLEGKVAIDYATGDSVTLAQGESLVVQAGEKHRSRSDTGALVLMFKAKEMFAE